MVCVIVANHSWESNQNSVEVIAALKVESDDNRLLEKDDRKRSKMTMMPKSPEKLMNSLPIG